MIRYILVVGVAQLSIGATFLRSQVVPGSYRPTPIECREAAKSLVDRTSNDARWQTLPACGKAGGRELAEALKDARSETDPTYLERLYGAMATTRDPDVFAAALTIMQDAGASAQARSTAILIAVAQHNNAVALPLNLSLAEALQAGRCRLLPINHAVYRSTNPLPVNSRAQLGGALLDVSAAPGTPSLVKTFVDCTRSVMSGAIAEAVPTSAIRLTYVCDNRYRVENQSTEPVEVSWAVSGKRTKAAIVVPPKGQNTFTAQRRGPTTLYYQRKAVQTESNSGRPCKS